jgi:hypothetical protein
MNSSKSAMLSAIIGAALLLVAVGLILVFLPHKKHAAKKRVVKAQENLRMMSGRPKQISIGR